MAFDSFGNGGGGLVSDAGAGGEARKPRAACSRPRCASAAGRPTAARHVELNRSAPTPDIVSLVGRPGRSPAGSRP